MECEPRYAVLAAALVFDAGSLQLRSSREVDYIAFVLLDKK